MVLDIGKNLFGKSFFKISPEDGEVLIFQGDRKTPAGIKSISTNTGATSPGTMADDATIGTVAWSNPDNAKVSDDVYATAGDLYDTTSHYLKATNFGFSIPTGATINGILVEVEAKLDTASSIYGSIKIVKSDATIGTTTRATAPNFDSTERYSKSGSSTDLWGETWTSADINNANFGIAFYIQNNVVHRTASVDHIRITVYYTTQSI